MDLCAIASQGQSKLPMCWSKTWGFPSGERLLLRGGNSPMMAACFLAALKAGLVAGAHHAFARAAGLEQIVDKAQVSAALYATVMLAEELMHCVDSTHAHYCKSLKQVNWFRSAEPTGVEAQMAKHSGCV
jgi:2-aminobenzoate-CoA ligase